MKIKRSLTKSHQKSIRQRTLRSEQLERREMLAGDMFCAGAALAGAGNAGTCQEDSAWVERMDQNGQDTTTSSISKGRGGGDNGSSQPGQNGPNTNLDPSFLSEAEVQDLLHMREEEKLARDVYTALGEKWEVPIFNNIAASESQHMEAVAQLIDKYGLEDPVGDLGPGEFSDPELKALHDELVDTGLESLVKAYQVGAQIEDLDIDDLQKAIERTDRADIDQVYENLMRGSRNHLRAFVTQLTAAGETYTPLYLAADEFNAIISSPAETANGQGNPNQSGPQGPGGPTTDDGSNPAVGGPHAFGNQALNNNSSESPLQNRTQDRDQDRDPARQRPQDPDQDQTQDRDRVRDRLFAQFGV